MSSSSPGSSGSTSHRRNGQVRGPVSGFAAWHVRGVARRDVSRCVHNNPEATRHDEIPPEPTAAEVAREEEEPREDPAPWNAAEGEWDGSTVEVMSTEEAQSWARRACLHFAGYQMFRQRMQNSRRNYVAAMLKLGIEITEENEANNSIIQTTVEVEEPEQEEPEPEEQEQEWISDDEEAEEETNVSWDPEWNEERPRISALRIDEVSEGEETESIRVLRRESTSRGWTIGKVVRPWIWGIAAGLPRQVAGQPEEDPGGQRLFWMMTTAMIFSYTVVVLLVALFCLWWWNRRSDYDYGRMIGDEGVPDRLWRWTEDDAVPGGVWDEINGEWIPDQRQPPSNRMMGWMTSSSEEESVPSIPPAYGRGMHMQRRYVFRPGQGRVRQGARTENPNVDQRPLRTSPSPTPRFGQSTGTAPPTPSSDTLHASESEMSGSIDEQGHFHIRQRGQRGDVGGEGQQGATTSTTLSEVGDMAGSMKPPSSSSGAVGTTSFSSSSGGGGSTWLSSSLSLQRPTTIPEVQGPEEEATLERPEFLEAASERGEGEPQTREEGPPPRNFEVFYTQYGEVYHKSRHCGKLRCAKRILRCQNCVRCANLVLRGEKISLDREAYHVLGTTCGSAVVNVLRACAECGY